MIEFVFAQGGPWAGLAFVGYMLATGRLVPRSALRDRERLADMYIKAYDREHEARILADKQVDEMLELGRTAHKVLEGLPPPKSGLPEGDEHASTVA